MNLEDLQSARSRERRTDSLQSLPDSFYTEAAAFVRELRAQREEVAAEADDPFDSPDVRRLTNSIKTAENTVEAIYERRVGKVVKLASLDAAGMTTDDDGLTPEERDLFGTLTDAIERNRTEVIEGLGTTDVDERADTSERVSESNAGSTVDVGGESAETTDPERAETAAGVAVDVPDEASPDHTPSPPVDDADVRAADAMGAAGAMGAPAGTASGNSGTGSASDSGPDRDRDATNTATTDGAGTGRTASASDAPETDTATTPEPTEADTTERETIRITRDVGQIVGIDERVYELASEDVVRLPAANAKPLVDRNAAERLE